MLAICSKCGNHIDRYAEKDYKLPCEKCGSTIMWILRLVMQGTNYFTLMDVSTGEEIKDSRKDFDEVWEDDWADYGYFEDSLDEDYFDRFDDYRYTDD